MRWIALVAVVVGCGGTHSADDHFPQGSQLISIEGTSVTCGGVVAPVAEAFTATSGSCEWTCVYSGTTLYARLRVGFERSDSAAAWRLATSEWTPLADGDCPGMDR